MADAVKPMNPMRYAIGFFGMSIPINLSNSQRSYFYVDVLGMDGAILALALVIYAIVDIVDNPVYGWLSDRTRSRWGRRRPWIVAAAPMLALSLYCLFSPPHALTGAALAVWFTVFAILTETFDSVIAASYGALLPEAFRNEKTRALANSARQAFQLIAMIVAIGLTPVITAAIGYSTTALIFGIVGAAVIIFTGLGVRENVAALPKKQAPLWASVKAIVSYPAFWSLGVASGLYSGGMALVVATVQFYVKYSLGLPPSNATFVLVAVIATSVLLLAGWTVLVRRFNALPLWRIALAILATALASLWFANSLPVAIALGCAIGLGFSGVMATIDLIVARLLDADLAKTGVHREAMFLTAFGFFNRSAQVFQALAFWLVAVLYGYRSGDNPGTRAGDAARLMTSGLPALLVFGAMLVSLLVTLTPSGRSTTPSATTAA